MTIVCKNCGNHFKARYCNMCSQKADTGRLRVKNVVDELWHNFTHTDRSVVGLVRDLFKHPGVVIREFIEGKRKKYFNPYTFFLVSSALLIFLTQQVFAYEDRVNHFNNEFGQYLSENYTIILLFSLPALAGILKLVFLKRDVNYSEWIVFLVFSWCIINTVQILIQGLYLLFIGYHKDLLGFTETLSYFILLAVLVKFIRPSNFIQILQCFISIALIFFFVELGSKLIALIYYGVPFKILIHNYKLF